MSASSFPVLDPGHTSRGGAVEITLTSDRPLALRYSLSPHRRGAGDPAHRVEADGSIWRTSRFRTGPVTYRLRQVDRFEVTCEVWGAGSAEFLDSLPGLVGMEDDADGFAPEHRILAEAHRRFPHLRIGRTGQVMEALVPAVLEQKVHGVAAFAAWRYLLSKFGEPAPGPAPAGMRVPPPAEVWRRVPSWEFHRANVDPKRSKTIVRSAALADKLEPIVSMTREDAERRLRHVPGIGVWTAAEVMQRALGDADALSVGDYHLASVIGWTLTGAPMTDDEMLEYLAPIRPHRYRAVRLIEVSGTALRPKFGPRTVVTDHRHH
ncbi:DNA-3-methyladenine glycosylase [Rhodococcus sp. SORGH_AS_0303]|uniref:DNA-3-methyladenine glycosylase family protein n=1 Tax=Rhodococcus sp. SORGH_AS_0303 TaxID=3041753 RepID=UPI0027804F89|nr:3-methyladenine DNA glycosylase/8-oxoguanine DNA glycosylase [Rhodococcus sp. SORGH_AS_0303]